MTSVRPLTLAVTPSGSSSFLIPSSSLFAALSATMWVLVDIS